MIDLTKMSIEEVRQIFSERKAVLEARLADLVIREQEAHANDTYTHDLYDEHVGILNDLRDNARGKFTSDELLTCACCGSPFYDRGNGARGCEDCCNWAIGGDGIYNFTKEVDSDEDDEDFEGGSDDDSNLEFDEDF